MAQPFRLEPLLDLEPLSKSYDRGSFSCGERKLNKFIKVDIDIELPRRLSKCYIAIDNQTNKLVGYYTLSASSISLKSISSYIETQGIHYQDAPVILLGRLATKIGFQGQGLGTALVYDAIETAMNSSIGAVGVVLDALTEKAKEWYLKPGREFDVLEDKKLIITFDKFLQIQGNLQNPPNVD